MPEIIAIIPSRFDSSRLPGKPLADIGGMTMIERVYRQATKAIGNVWVATDDSRIMEVVERFGGKCVMTSANHTNGTSRIAEAYEAIGGASDVVINIQGDEPFVSPEEIKTLADLFADADTEIATLVAPITEADGFSSLADPNRVKAALDTKGGVMMFSRSIIPYVRGVSEDNWLDATKFYSHVGMYGYRADVLKKIVKLPQSPLEKAESLEQLRWLENGYRIKAAIVNSHSKGIDTPADLEAARKRVSQN